MLKKSIVTSLKFRELKSFLCGKRIGLNVKGKVYEACVRSCMIYGGERWAMSVEVMRKLERTEITMLMLMYAVRLQDRLTVEVEGKRLRGRLGRYGWK